MLHSAGLDAVASGLERQLRKAGIPTLLITPRNILKLWGGRAVSMLFWYMLSISAFIAALRCSRLEITYRTPAYAVPPLVNKGNSLSSCQITFCSPRHETYQNPK